MIKAIIFDFFGVLANEGTVSFSRNYYSDDPKRLDKTWRLQDELNLGRISIEQYKDQLAKLGGVDRKTVNKYLDHHQPNRPLLDYIRSVLKPRYKIGILSNAGDDWTLEILGEKDLALFDEIILSYREGIIKPEPQIYELAAQNLGIKVSEAIFTDDKERYCTAAENAGMRSVVYSDFQQFKSELEKLLAAVPNN